MFQVGQKVVCVNHARAKEWILEGSIYTIRWIGKRSTDTTVCVFLDECVAIHPAGCEWGFNVGRFRPVVSRKTDISIFTAMLTKAPKRKVMSRAG